MPKPRSGLSVHGMRKSCPVKAILNLFNGVLNAGMIGSSSAAMMRTLETDELDFVYRVAEGPAAGRWLSARARLTRGSQGQPVRLVGIVRDVTAERLSGEVTQEQSLLVQSMLDAMPQLVVITDAEADLIEREFQGALTALGEWRARIRAHRKSQE